jgi:hypothetical protein
MRRITITSLTLIAAALLVVPATAGAAKSKGPVPKITRVQPMRVSIGGLLTISGKNFKAKRARNTVIFRAANGRTAFAKPARASRKKLVVRVPAAVSRLLKVASSGQRPTRLQLRVLAGKFSKFTPRRLSPVVTGPGDGDGGPGGGSQVCNTKPDYDGDLLLNSTELNTTKTDPCLKDSDKDGVEDGFEYQSALDLNDDEHQQPNTALPYPGKRPYPNPLDPSDANIDFDRDVLSLSEEQRLWRYSIAIGTASETLTPLYYSDGMQASLHARRPDGRRIPTMPVGAYPRHQEFVAWASASGYRNVELTDGRPWWDHDVTRNTYGLFDFNRDGVETDPRAVGYRTSELYYFDYDNDRFVSDDERDEDADGLTNYEETRGRLMGGQYWAGCYSAEAPFPVPYAGTDVTDSDSDGDGVRDGADDQDHDDVPNLLETSRNMASGLDDRDSGTDCKPQTGLPTPPATHHSNVYGRVNPFNPCLPASWSRTCDLHPGLDGAPAPFDGSPNWYSLQ